MNELWETLSARQKQVLLGILDGHQKKEVAADLGITATTVSACKFAAFRKLHLRNEIDLVRFAIRNGVIEA